jgi:hypothetical protein
LHFSAKRGDGSELQSVHAVLIEVPGAGLTKAGRVLGVTVPRLELNGEPALRVRVENGGNTHLKVTGTITIRDRLRRKTVATIPVSGFYVLPGTTTTHTIVWRNPPLVAIAHAKVHLDLLEACNGQAAAACEATGSGVVLHWWIIAGFAAFLFVLRIALAIASFRRRRRERRAVPRAAYRAPEPAAAASGNGGLWDRTVSVQNSMALRRARQAIAMLRQGAGETGVRVEVALGLLRSVRDVSDVVAEVESAYEHAPTQREAAALALALQEVDSARAAEALLRGYAKADRVLAQRIKRALAQIDPADLRAHRDLMDALPASRRGSLPVG